MATLTLSRALTPLPTAFPVCWPHVWTSRVQHRLKLQEEEGTVPASSTLTESASTLALSMCDLKSKTGMTRHKLRGCFLCQLQEANEEDQRENALTVWTQPTLLPQASFLTDLPSSHRSQNIFISLMK